MVVGAGHAGLEAAFAAARVGARVVVVTGRLDTIGQTPCNPSVGGVAKGHIVKEIEALGGFMGRAADACAIHGRILNRSRGPAVRATRVQVDKARYGAHARAALESHPDITIVAALVAKIDLAEGTARGVILGDGARVAGDAVVVTTGTFLGGVLHTGAERTPGGRVGEPPAIDLAAHLAALGFVLRRLKTGTPPRLDGRSIDFSQCAEQPGDGMPGGVAAFGKKDYQQVLVVQRMVKQFALPIEILAGETQRADDGLALSSRNSYLTPDERREAVHLSRALQTLGDAARSGTGSPDLARLAALEAQAMQALARRGWTPMRCAKLPLRAAAVTQRSRPAMSIWLRWAS